MSSAGDLFITEELKDAVSDDVLEMLEGEENWRINPNGYIDVWDRADIQSGSVNIYIDNRKKVGTVEFKVNPLIEIDDLTTQRYIDVELAEYTVTIGDKKVTKDLTKDE